MLKLLSVFLLCISVIGCAAKPAAQSYVFSRSFLPGSDLTPRGGTTQGQPVKLDLVKSKQWLALQEKALESKERDRQAILAMTGDYKATFEFIETIPFDVEYEMDRPYRSWATEKIFAIANEPGFVSLQHVMVMYFVRDQKVSEPVVIKHWRQDWTYEPTSYHEFVGDGQWRRRQLSASESKGLWLQEVFHVDDSPRYASVGAWEHNPSFSSWTGNKTFRPLPRREYSVRSDYAVLEGVNRHIVLPTGWVHEQENLKRVVGEKAGTFVARELGLNRYQRIIGQDFSAGDEYWTKSKEYWKEVRSFWANQFQSSKQFSFTAKVNKKSLIEKHFSFVDSLSEDMTSQEFARKAAEMIKPHIQESGAAPSGSQIY